MTNSSTAATASPSLVDSYHNSSSNDLPKITLSGDQDLSNVQGDKQQSMLNKMAVDSILDSSSDVLKIPDDYAAHLCEQGCTAERRGSCKCTLSLWTLERLEQLSSNNKKQIDFYQKLVENFLASASGKAPVGANDELPCEAEFLYLANLSKDSDKIVQDLKSEIQKANCRSAQIVQHQKERNKAELEAEKKPLKFMASGTKSEVFDIPKSLGRYVLKVGPRQAILQERLNIYSVEEALQKFGSLIRSSSENRKLVPLSVPRITDGTPTGWVALGPRGRSLPGIVRASEDLNPRIPSIDSDDQVGMVLDRIRDLPEDTRAYILGKYCDLNLSDAADVMRTNDYCLVRPYLGMNSNGVDVASVATVEHEPRSLVNLPVYLDQIRHAHRNTSIPLEAIAEQIAHGYALLHWGAGFDGRGTEFLLGSSTTGLGIQMHMLDFEDCRPLRAENIDCVIKQLVTAAVKNDPYIPRAYRGRNDETEWKRIQGTNRYREVYTARSDEIYTWHIVHDGAEHGDDEESERGESDSQDGTEYVECDEDDPNQVSRELSEDDEYGNDDDDSDSCDTEDSSEEEEESDEDDDDTDWATHNLFWFGTAELTFTPMPYLPPILKNSPSRNNSSTAPPKHPGEPFKRKVTFYHRLPSYKEEKPANAPYWKRTKSRSPILLGFH
ncbi:hypothetical protein Daus18300_006163 [Diaporthe australafricana]|uniref:DUF3669 domain-containing protein n=1 Tax=Diaporthe australafricana TaxID=127596 RepID=A0ABR3WW39_9PEZI